MPLEILTEPWAAAWCRALNESETYRAAAASWEGAVAIVMTADPAQGVAERRAVHLDLWHGTCRGSRVATDADLAQARYVLQASPAVWNQLLDGSLDAVAAVMAGKLSLVRGSLASLLPYVGAAKALVAAAARLDAASS